MRTNKDPRNMSRAFTWDALQRLRRIDYPDVVDRMSFTNHFGYDSIRRKFWYNNQGLLVAVSNALGQVSATVFNTNDRPVNVTEANRVTVTNTFDNLGRLLTRTTTDNAVEKWVYTQNILPADQLHQPNDQRLGFTLYDPALRLTNEVPVGQYTNSVTFGAASDLLTLTDGKSHTTCEWTGCRARCALPKTARADGNNLSEVIRVSPAESHTYAPGVR